MTTIPQALPLTYADEAIVPSHVDARRMLARGLEPELAELRRLRLRKRLKEMAIFTGLWTFSLWINYTGITTGPGPASSLLRILGTLGTAFAVNAFILFLHEGMHNTLFARRAWNRWISAALGWLFCISFTAYQVMHTRHHNFLGDPRDPDDYQNYSKNRSLLWVMHYARLIVGPYLYILVIPIQALRFGTTRERRRVVEEYLALLTVYTLAAALVPGWFLLHLWFIPLVITAHMTAVRGLTQHGITNAQDPFLASRSIRANSLVTFLLLNENYHLEHHLFPEIPSYNLRKVHELIRPRLPRVVTGKSYLAFLFKFFLASLKMDDRPIGFTDLVEWEV